MGAFPTILAGQRVTASLLTSMLPLTVVKTADQSVTSSTALVSDAALLLPVAANATYLFTCYLDYEGGTQGSSDLQWTWNLPSLATLRYQRDLVGTGGSVSVGVTQFGGDIVVARTNGAGSLLGLSMHGSLITSATAGNLQLKWAQNTSSATPTIVHAQSSLALWRTS